MAKEFTEVTTHITVDLGPRKRASVFFRPILAIPALILLSILTSLGMSMWRGDREEVMWTDQWGNDWMRGDNSSTFSFIPLTVMIPVILLLLFAGIYPIWILKFAHGVQSFDTKVNAYLFLLRDEYPTVRDVDYAYVTYPDIEEGAKLSRGLPLVKWFLAIPMYVVLFFAALGTLFVTLLAWFAIVFTGKYPASLAKLPLGFIGFWNRVQGYAFTLVTDSYPRIRT